LGLNRICKYQSYYPIQYIFNYKGPGLYLTGNKFEFANRYLIINKANLLNKSWLERKYRRKQSEVLKLLKRKENDTTEFNLKKARDLSLSDARMILITEGPEA